MRFLSDLWRILRNDKGALVGGVIVLIYCLVAILGPMFVTVSDNQDATTPTCRRPGNTRWAPTRSASA